MATVTGQQQWQLVHNCGLSSLEVSVILASSPRPAVVAALQEPSSSGHGEVPAILALPPSPAVGVVPMTQQTPGAAEAPATLVCLVVMRSDSADTSSNKATAMMRVLMRPLVEVLKGGKVDSPMQLKMAQVRETKNFAIVPPTEKQKKDFFTNLLRIKGKRSFT